MEKKAKDNRSKFLLGNTIIFAISIFGTKIISFFLLPLYTSVLTTTQYGQIDLTTSINALLPFFLTFCISDAVLRFVIENQKEKKKILTFGIRIISFGYMILLAGFVVLCCTTKIIYTNPYYLFLVVLFPFENYRTLFSSFLKGIEKTKDILIESIVSTIIILIFTIVSVVCLGWGVYGYLGSMGCGALFGCIYFLIRIKKECHGVIEKGLAKELKKQMLFYSLPLIINGVSWWLNSGADKFVINLFWGESANGIYSVAGKIPSILTLITSVFAQSWSLSSLKACKDDDYDQFFTNVYNTYNALLIVGASALILLNMPISKLLFAEDFFIANECSSILIVSVMFNSLAGCISGTFSAFKKSKVLASTTISSAVINLALNFLLIPKWGCIGAATATAISFFVLWLLRLICSRKYVKIKINLPLNILSYVLLGVQLVCDHTPSRHYWAQGLIFIFVILINFKYIKKIADIVLGKFFTKVKVKMMKKYDFLFVYEVKNRELENIILIKQELERRGYKVAVRETWRAIHYPYAKVDAKVVITFACYNDGQIQDIASFVKNPQKIVNLQWEQLYTIADEDDKNGLYCIKDFATKISHVCWGNFNYDRLQNVSKIDKKNLILAGQLTFDFYKPKLDGYYLSREELFEKYNINPNDKTYLFISSFSYVDMSDKELGTGVYTQTANNSLDFKDISVRSQNEVLNWVEEVLEEHKDVIFIYRPHPAETGNKRLALLEDKYSNFRVIRDCSVKQWILTCDKIYTWYSTAIAEVYAAGKQCSVLRPCEIPNPMEVRIYQDGDFITDKKVFKETYLSENIKFPLREETLKYYYKFSDDYTYNIISDSLEEILKKEEFIVDFSPILDTPKKFEFLRFLKSKLAGVGRRCLASSKLLQLTLGKNKKFKGKIEHHKFVKKMIINNYASKKEIKIIQDKIENLINKNTIKDSK